jgi:hypothetical protein
MDEGKLDTKLLMVENMRLKKELSAFDNEFFEELEDLKYNYKQMQVKIK